MRYIEKGYRHSMRPADRAVIDCARRMLADERILRTADGSRLQNYNRPELLDDTDFHANNHRKIANRRATREAVASGAGVASIEAAAVVLNSAWLHLVGAAAAIVASGSIERPLSQEKRVIDEVQRQSVADANELLSQYLHRPSELWHIDQFVEPLDRVLVFDHFNARFANDQEEFGRALERAPELDSYLRNVTYNLKVLAFQTLSSKRNDSEHYSQEIVITKPDMAYTAVAWACAEQVLAHHDAGLGRTLGL